MPSLLTFAFCFAMLMPFSFFSFLFYFSPFVPAVYFHALTVGITEQKIPEVYEEAAGNSLQLKVSLSKVKILLPSLSLGSA